MSATYKIVFQRQPPYVFSFHRGTNIQRFTFTQMIPQFAVGSTQPSARGATQPIRCVFQLRMKSIYHMPSTTAAQPWTAESVHYIMGGEWVSCLNPLKCGSGNRKMTCRWGKWVGKIAVAQKQNSCGNLPLKGLVTSLVHICEAVLWVRAMDHFVTSFSLSSRVGKLEKVVLCQHSHFLFATTNVKCSYLIPLPGGSWACSVLCGQESRQQAPCPQSWKEADK